MVVEGIRPVGEGTAVAEELHILVEEMVPHMAAVVEGTRLVEEDTVAEVHRMVAVEVHRKAVAEELRILAED